MKSVLPTITRETAQVALVYYLQLCIWLLLEYTSYSGTGLWAARVWILVVVSHTYNMWLYWEEQFSHRPSRADPKCPSHKSRPGLNSTFSSGPQDPQIPNICEDVFVGEEHKKRRVGEATIFIREEDYYYPSKNRAEYLDADHICISFLDYLWLNWFLRPSLVVLFFVGGPSTQGLFGIMKLRLREWFGWVKPNSTEYLEKALFNLIVHSTLATWIVDIKQDKADNTMTGELRLAGVAHILRTKTVAPGDLNITLNFDKKAITKATFEGEPIQYPDALVLVFHSVVLRHTFVHAYSNWGVNLDVENDPFIRRMGLCTVYLNNLGLSGYAKAVAFYHAIGLLKYTTLDVVSRIMERGPINVPPHLHLHQLRKYSSYIDFIVQVHRYFLSEFVKYKKDFPGIDGEAHFIGTVLHSLDHGSAVHQINITNFVGSTEEFSGDRELAALTLSCLTDRPPFMLFECRFSHASHPFYRRVYRFAATIDKRLADYMECAIVM